MDKPSAKPSRRPSRPRRSAARHDCSVETTLTPLGDAAGGAVRATVREISATGTMFDTPVRLGVGERFRLAITGPQGDGHEATLIVRWSSGVGNRWSSGAQFIADDRLLLAAGVTPDRVAAGAAYARSVAGPAWARSLQVDAPQSIRVRALCATRMDCGVDLAVEQIATDCELDVQGKLLAASAVIEGGTTHVLGEAEVGDLGTSEGRRTIVVLGSSVAVESLLRAAKDAIADLRKAVSARRATSVLAERGDEKMSASERESIMVSRFDAEQMGEKLERMERNARVLQERIERMRAWKLTVHRTLHRGVEVSAGGRRMVFTAALEGPVTLALDQAGELVVTGAGAPVSVLGKATLGRVAA
jgi:hypothetical protein